jgi:hypothetical protein
VRSWLAQALPVLSEETVQIAARVSLEGDDALLRRRRLTPGRQARLQELARSGLSHAAIARITGLHRVTVARWLKIESTAAPTEAPDLDRLPPEEPPCPAVGPPEPALAAAEVQTAPPPAPWTSWAQVRQAREVLKEHRWLLLRRPDHLSHEQQDLVHDLATGPLADLVGVARRFLLDWYALWRTDDGHRRTLAEAQERYDSWHANPEYQALAPLRRVQDLLTPARFTRLSQFLRQPHWEATNNGAERTGRAFRHGQAPHFRLRTEAAIDGALRVVAFQAKERAAVPPLPFLRLCPRGRHAPPGEPGAQAA